LLPSQVSKLICSLPFLEDLDITCYKVGSYDCDNDTPLRYPASPPLTGTLELCWARGIESTARQLLDLPNGIHFRLLDCMWYREDDLQWINTLVDGCADTLHYCCIRVERSSLVTSQVACVDFSRATKLKGVEFQLEDLSDVSAVMALKTLIADYRDFQEITICLPDDDSVDGRRQTEEVHGQWMDLDRFLAHLWKPDAFRVWLIYRTRGEGEACELAEWLLPEMTKKGIVELVDYDAL
ncbi:hypothetical protein BJ322DRAFT_1177224, partial [Thelephora terrestris]